MRLCIRILQNNTKPCSDVININMYQCVCVVCERKEEQKKNPAAVRGALKAFVDNFLESKAAKYLLIGTNSSTSAVNDDDEVGESGISSDESQQTTQSSETVDAAAEVCSVQYCVQQLCTVRCTHI